MAIETKYICDRCNHTQETSEQMWKVGVGRQGVNYTLENNHAINLQALWCRKCCETFRLLPPNKEKEQEHVLPEEKVTLESLIKEIVREELENG